MRFEAVLGHEATKRSILQMNANDRMPHAILLLGAAGSGKLALATALAQYILCEQKTPSDACGQCRSCVKAAKYIHPDLHFSFPTVGSKATSDQYLAQWRTLLQEDAYPTVFNWLQRIGAENKQGNITKEECLNIVKKINLKAFEGTHKVLVMWMPEYLGNEGNRLLKLIEEPPANTIFILVAERQEQILNTILSRCQLIKVHPLSDEAIQQGLMQRAVPEEQALEIARLVNGNFAEALQLVAEDVNNNAPLFLDWMRKCYKGNGAELVEWVGSFAGMGREQQKFFLQYGLHFMRELLVFSVTQDLTRLRLSKNEKKTVNNLIKIVGVKQIDKITMLLDELIFGVERNANPKVLFLDASLQINSFLRAA